MFLLYQAPLMIMRPITVPCSPTDVKRCRPSAPAFCRFMNHCTVKTLQLTLNLHNDDCVSNCHYYFLLFAKLKCHFHNFTFLLPSQHKRNLASWGSLRGSVGINLFSEGKGRNLLITVTPPSTLQPAFRQSLLFRSDIQTHSTLKVWGPLPHATIEPPLCDKFLETDSGTVCVESTHTGHPSALSESEVTKTIKSS